MIKQAHNTFHNDLETIVKEGGNKSIHYLLAQAVDIEKNPREIQYRMILRLKDSNPKSYQEWLTAMETEIKALNLPCFIRFYFSFNLNGGFIAISTSIFN